MAIKIIDTTTPEVLKYDHIFVTSMDITQDITDDVSNPSVYKVVINYRLYAVNSLGALFFKKENYSVVVPDYVQAGIGKANLGDTSMLDTLASIQGTISLLISDKGLHGDTEVII